MQNRHHPRRSLALLACVVSLSLPACYPHRGAPHARDAQVLLDEARAACARRDEAAAVNLLERLAREHPTHPRAEEAASLEQQGRPCALFSTPP